VGAPHPQLPFLQGGEVALSGATLGLAPTWSGTGAPRGVVLRLRGVRRLGRRQDPELNVLDGFELPGPPVI